MWIILNTVKDLLQIFYLFQILQARGLNINLICLKLLLRLLRLYFIEVTLYYTQKCENYVISINKSSVTPSFGLVSTDKLQIICILCFSDTFIFKVKFNEWGNNCNFARKNTEGYVSSFVSTSIFLHFISAFIQIYLRAHIWAKYFCTVTPFYTIKIFCHALSIYFRKLQE